MSQPEQSEELPRAEEREDGQDDADLLQQRLEEAERESGQFRTMAQRAQADLVNYKKRAAEEIEETRRQTASGFC